MSRKPTLSVALDNIAAWSGARDGVMCVGGIEETSKGTKSAVRRGGYIWIGEEGKTGRCLGFIGIGKFLRLARNIEKLRRSHD